MAGALIKGEKVDTGRENEWGCAGRDGVRSHKSRKAVSVERRLPHIHGWEPCPLSMTPLGAPTPRPPS